MRPICGCDLCVYTRVLPQSTQINSLTFLYRIIAHDQQIITHNVLVCKKNKLILICRRLYYCVSVQLS